MKIIFALLVSFLSVTNLWAQNHEKEISDAFFGFREAMKAKDYDKILEYAHPGVFQVLPRETYLQVLRGGLEDTYMTVSVGEGVVHKVYPVRTIVGTQYSYLEASIALSISITSEDIKSTFESMYGEENTTWNAETETLEVTAKSTSIVAKVDEAWRFIECNSEMAQAFSGIIPAEVFENAPPKN